MSNEPMSLSNAISWITRGYYVIPIPFRTKGPNLKGWENLRLDALSARQHFNGAPQNIGVLLGGKDGLADVDLDCPEALRVASAFLPTTGMIFGRKSKPKSHYFYRCIPGVSTSKYIDPGDNGTLCELRCQKKDGSVGLQTVVPSSVHECGEVIRFDVGFDREPASVSAGALQGAVAKVAAASLLAKRWPDRNRHVFELALAGMLAQAGWVLNDVLLFVTTTYTAVATHDPAATGRVASSVRDTFEKLASGENITGAPVLVEHVGKGVVAKVQEWLGLRTVRFQSSGLPGICVTGRQLRETSEDALKALQRVKAQQQLFTRSGFIVAVQMNERGRQEIRLLDENGLRGRLSRAADFFRLSPNGDRTACAPPMEVVRDIRSRPSVEWKFPSLEALIETPVLRPDGSILNTPGYDPLTGYFYAPDPELRIPTIDDHPSLDQVATARALIEELIHDFPFVDRYSHANAIAGLLTPIVKCAIGAPSPLQVNDAPQAGSGKSLFAEVQSLVVTGRNAEMFSAPKDDDEWRKQITTAVLSGTSIVVFDNVVRPLDSPELCKALTETQHADRAFGTQEKLLLPVNSVFIATGNNIKLAGDMPRRCYRVRLDAQNSRPYLRAVETFRHPDLKAWAKEKRGELLAALLTLARAWYAAGRPTPTVKPLGSFESWTKTVGGILEYASIDGFLGNANELYEEADVESAEWQGFLETLHAKFNGEPFTTAEIAGALSEKTWNEQKRSVELTASSLTLRASVPEQLTESIDKETFGKRLGRCFGERVDRRFGETQIHLKKYRVLHGIQQWAVIKSGASR